jgi:hypothetical protein
VDKHELDNTRGSRRDLSKGMDVRHDIMSTLLLLLGCNLKLFGREMQIDLHLLDRFIWDRKSELFLCDRKVKPQLAPSMKAILRFKSMCKEIIDRYYKMRTDAEKR